MTVTAETTLAKGFIPEVATPPPAPAVGDEETLPITNCGPVFQTGCGSVTCFKCGSFLTAFTDGKTISEGVVRYTCNRPYACDAEFDVYGEA